MNEQDPDLKGLQSFANRRDREGSPIFVGREREIEHVLMHADLVGEAHAEGEHTQGATIVITGCPGSGKSAFLEHFARTFANLELTRTVLIPVICIHQDLTARNSEELGTQIVRLAERTREGLHKTFLALGEDVGRALKLANTYERLERKLTKKTRQDTVVCLLVDEIQNVTEASAHTVQMLHTQAFSPPVLPIYAGLDDSVDRLRTVCGISRLSANAHMTMGALGEHAAQEATAQLFEKYRVRDEASAQGSWAKAIDEEALGFAQHLHVALQAACAVLVESNGTARAEDATEVKRRARAARERFYASKITGSVQVHARAVLDVVHQAVRTNAALTERHLAKWAKESMHRHDPLSGEFSNEEALALVERMRHQGILHLSAQDQPKVPIPSLQAWLTGPYARHIGWHPPPDPKTHETQAEPPETSAGRRIRAGAKPLAAAGQQAAHALQHKSDKAEAMHTSTTVEAERATRRNTDQARQMQDRHRVDDERSRKG